MSDRKREQQALTSEEQWRVNIYRLLANLLAVPPTDEVLTRLCVLGEGTNNSTTGSLSGVWGLLANAAGDVSVASVYDEYNLLFIGMTRGEIMPYASWYLTGFLMEKPLAVLRDDLRRLGIQRQADTHEPEDHAAALLEAMSILIEAGDDNQWCFFDSHIKPWMVSLFDDIKAAESARFYRSVGQLGLAFLRSESEFSEI